MKRKTLAIAIACITTGLLGSCQKDNGIDNPQQNDLPAGALPGKFSVSKTKQVHFSQGNLYWNRSEFMFEDKQYDFSPEDTYDIDIEHISHFYWGKSASVACSEIWHFSGAAGDVFFTNETSETAGKDFVVNGVKGKYRTLSADEWEYLLMYRPMKNEVVGRYTLNITYGGKKGMVLYPDDYAGSRLKSGTKYSDENFPGDCVFLPAAGRRENFRVLEVGSTSVYWSASAFGIDKAYSVFSNSSMAFEKEKFVRNNGACVRLVTEVE